MPPSAPRRRSGIFHVESTRLRSNVADQVQRDLLPAGRMLSVFLVLCELFAEFAVLVWSRGHTCDRPLRFWLAILIMLQVTTVLLNCLNICQRRAGMESFRLHRNGLSATDIDMYADTPSAPSTSSPASNDVIVQVMHQQSAAASENDRMPLLDHELQQDQSTHMVLQQLHHQSQPQSHPNHPPQSPHSSTPPSSQREFPHYQQLSESSRALVSPQFVDGFIRLVNLWYLAWFILGSIWVSDGGTCSTEAPHLYRLIVALTIIYYALLFLPLACFCLIVCCLPLFILIYRIMLPYAERERRRARAADPAQVQNLSSITFSAETFLTHTGSENLDDASCVICLCDYEDGETVRFLPCKHHFHKDCVDVWLRLDKACCLCKQDIDAHNSSPASSLV
ncbi:E3 ubiquitin-protein ligase [Gracilariopsis chorda]|uniref:E3 ubiquitin-protein ligase n=1 Tax=Gracilariopsis chorda TaxID=448386 RepID=A0A2V3IK85_9FLOR|nr:E3 ubiquitin-protein ligase [Gracilariopsis chorda]|eukprot:PXF41540.1 E3 ubiquitin-protein ligase [Gracilariopsis chorda]